MIDFINYQFSFLGYQLRLVDLIGSIIGLFYIVSEYMAGRWFWTWCLLMSLFYIIIDFSSGYYANGTICCYNFVMSIYGILVWRGIVQSSKKEERPFGSCPLRYLPWIFLIVILLTTVLWKVLGLLGESHYPLLDGFTSAVSIMGMWMITQKWWQQWLCWMIVNPLMVLLFWLGGNYASAVLYFIFSVVCVFGMFKWRKEVPKTK